MQRCVPPSEMFLWIGGSRFKLQFLVILAWLSNFFLKDVFKNSEGVFQLSSSFSDFSSGMG